MSNNGGSSNGTIDFKLYRYTPSLAAAIIAVLLFSILSMLHLWKLVRNRTLYFIPFLIGGIFELIGYSGRIWSHYQPLILGGFIMQAILILVAPALFAASIYMILGRLIRTLHAEHLAIIPVKWTTRIFVTSDVVSFLLQSGGGGIQAGGTMQMFDLGEKIIIGGLFLQLVVFGFFVAAAMLLHKRLLQRPTAVCIEGQVQWRRHLYVLYATSTLILIRSVVRVVEYLQGNGGYIISHEAFIYCLDMLLMATVMAIFFVWYVDDLRYKEKDMYARDSGEVALNDRRIHV